MGEERTVHRMSSLNNCEHVHKESIIDDMSAKLKSLLDKLKEPSLHCKSSINGYNNDDLPTLAR